MERSFISYTEALDVIADHQKSFAVITVPIVDVGGHFLAEDLIADRDFPPYNRVAMDGIAINHSSFARGVRSFPIEKTVGAGAPQVALEDVNNCIEIMTGGILPKNVDTVIRYEDLTIENGTAAINLEEVTRRKNIHFKGMDIAQGTIIKKAGGRLSSAEINVAASIGKHELKVYKMPKAAIISTGDELVDVHETPLAHQIRRSNVYGIKNTLQEWGINSDLKHIPDDKNEMEVIIDNLLKDYDFLVITGGVSKGKYDYLPDVLKNLGVVKQFHKIKQKPGKPFWFGVSNEGKPVFALPGNPVSSFVCTYIYIRHWLRSSLKMDTNFTYVTLAEDILFKPELTFFIESKIKNLDNGTIVATAVFGNGSGDFINLVNTDGFLILPPEKEVFKKGEVYPFVYYRNEI
ncbi:molybdopterin molybdotransferase MoeA [Spongiivirga citrea]|uniref:Molybdopterin molybdenumtransferase n=1 Tax=Spongiivirga citrea TaxID=1481457 RepID=A0A6M0CP91_9FLAO|nr:molybdopterin molybdotransferase MoeA [Spongiivirga citrea]NER18753.1 molybdopterin molybdenumtransferase MoeA [Spongiivirga citrea]